MTNITFSQVQKSFHKKLVLDIPDFQADSGEIFSIVGGNGAGKSTFIKLLAGIFLQDYARHHQASIFITSHDASFIEKVSTRVVVIQEGRLYREGTFEEIFGNVHQHEVYHLLLDKSAESVLKQRFPELDYKVLDGGISVETRNPDLYRLLLEETEVLQFTREPASLEDLLYEVLK